MESAIGAPLRYLPVTTPLDAPPLTPALSPEYRGEGVTARRPLLFRLPLSHYLLKLAIILISTDPGPTRLFDLLRAPFVLFVASPSPRFTFIHDQLARHVGKHAMAICHLVEQSNGLEMSCRDIELKIFRQIPSGDLGGPPASIACRMIISSMCTNPARLAAASLFESDPSGTPSRAIQAANTNGRPVSSFQAWPKSTWYGISRGSSHTTLSPISSLAACISMAAGGHENPNRRRWAGCRTVQPAPREPARPTYGYHDRRQAIEYARWAHRLKMRTVKVGPSQPMPPAVRRRRPAMRW